MRRENKKTPIASRYQHDGAFVFCSLACGHSRAGAWTWRSAWPRTCQRATSGRGARRARSAAKKDEHDLTQLCSGRAASVGELPIDRIAQAVGPTDTQQAALEELRAASAKAAENLKSNCPNYQPLTPAGRVEAMEQRLTAMLAAIAVVQPALTKFYDSLTFEQRARFNTLGALRA